MRGLRIGVVGYGIAGIAAAIHLRAMGHRIDHFERRAADVGAGAGMLLQPPALALLGALDIGSDALAYAARVNGFGARDCAGRTLTRVEYEHHRPGSYALGIQRRYLIESLRNRDEGRMVVNASREVVAVDAARGILRFADSAEAGPYDLVVAADGSSSRLRASFPALLEHDRLYDSAAIVACMDDADGRAGDRLIQVFDGTRHVAVWPVGASGPGQIRQANVSINCPTAHADAFSRSGAWKAVVARHCPALLPMIENLPCGFLPLVYRYRDVAMQRLVAGRVVFIGDAAHSMSPLLGQGARMALLDAATLAQCLREGVDTDAALDAFDRRCRAQVETFQTISRWLTPVFQSQSRIASALRLSVQLSQRLPFFASRARELLIGEGPMNF